MPLHFTAMPLQWNCTRALAAVVFVASSDVELPWVSIRGPPVEMCFGPRTKRPHGRRSAPQRPNVAPLWRTSVPRAGPQLTPTRCSASASSASTQPKRRAACLRRRCGCVDVFQEARERRLSRRLRSRPRSRRVSSSLSMPESTDISSSISIILSMIAPSSYSDQRISPS